MKHSSLIYCLLIFAIALFVQCSPSIENADSNKPTPIVLELIDSVKQEFAPDKRVALFQVEAISKSGGELILRGETNNADAKHKLLNKLTSAELAIVDSIQVLPLDGSLNGKFNGIIRFSNCNIRSKPGHSQELATQAIMGTPIKILKQEKEWFYIQTPDGYLGWLHDGEFVPMSETELAAWKEAPKVLYLPTSGALFDQPSTNASALADLVSGNILLNLGSNGRYLKVGLADGQTGYVPRSSVTNLNEWLKNPNPDSKTIEETALALMGRPYTWGGTSTKGMDCSGFTKTVFFLNGVILQRDASQQVHYGNLVDTDTTWKNLEKGDLLFFGRKQTDLQRERITHVAIYLGNGQIIHAGSSNGAIAVESLIPNDPDFAEDRYSTFIRARRVLNAINTPGIERVADNSFYN